MGDPQLTAESLAAYQDVVDAAKSDAVSAQDIYRRGWDDAIAAVRGLLPKADVVSPDGAIVLAPDSGNAGEP